MYWDEMYKAWICTGREMQGVLRKKHNLPDDWKPAEEPNDWKWRREDLRYADPRFIEMLEKNGYLEPEEDA